MNALVYSSSLAAAFLGGIVALFAPCCIVSLLPMFVGAAIQRGRVQLPVTTGLFVAGVAAVLLPVVLGVGALGQLFAAHHAVWNRWAIGGAADLAAALRGVPAFVQALLLVLLAASLGTALYSASRRE